MILPIRTGLISTITIASCSALGALAGDRLDASTSIPLGNALAVAAVVVPAMIWLGRKFQQIEDRDAQNRTDIKNLDREFAEFRSSLKHLPCVLHRCDQNNDQFDERSSKG